MAQLSLTGLNAQKRLVLAIVLMFLTAIGISIGTSNQTANAAGCHIFGASTEGQGDFEAFTSKYTVPSSSACNDIQVRWINRVGYQGQHCFTALVQFYPSSGGSYDGPPKYVCSTPNSGSWKVLSTNVANGTRYRIVYAMPQVGDRFNFQIMD